MNSNLVSRLSDLNIKRTDFHYLHYTSFHRDLTEAIREFSSGRVLDIGCGNKPYEFLFKDKVSEYIGCDIVQSDLEKVDIICEANKIPQPDESFDTVISTQVIEHVNDQQGLVNEAYRLLKKDKFLIISGPMYWPIHGDPYDYFRFTKNGFELLLSRSGFTTVKVYSNGGMWATTGQSLIHSFINSKSNHFFLRLSRSLFYRLRMYVLFNRFFGWLDKKDFNPVNTMNYVIIAKK